MVPASHLHARLRDGPRVGRAKEGGWTAGNRCPRPVQDAVAAAGDTLRYQGEYRTMVTARLRPHEDRRGSCGPPGHVQARLSPWCSTAMIRPPGARTISVASTLTSAS